MGRDESGRAVGVKQYSFPVAEQFRLIVDSGGSDTQVFWSRQALIRHFTDVVEVSYGHAMFLADEVISDAIQELRLREPQI